MGRISKLKFREYFKMSQSVLDRHVRDYKFNYLEIWHLLQDNKLTIRQKKTGLYNMKKKIPESVLDQLWITYCEKEVL